ncbi:uncharacterized protein FA14DRAFT_179433 [Meira miltonrushii]|uniref:Uncharacterized protein n=1 Tax=Meira miltonrushii TaxID=1280837 RepID=A0A316VG72_9BASI|nr:uncharacterized protein FA14DRAFT_179433 [Meira miltonrushii]PWN36068.1 hypothetical protein FA14DRAFT_179433 [Meira miltonrushii]
MAQRPMNDHQAMTGGTRGVPLMMPNRNSPLSGMQQQQNFQLNQMHLQQQQHNQGSNGQMMQHNLQQQPQMQMNAGPNSQQQQNMNLSSDSKMQGRMQAPQRNIQQQQQQQQPSQQINVRPMHLEAQHQMQQSPISPQMDISTSSTGMMSDRNEQNSKQVAQGSPTQPGDVQRMLHLYMHDYCLKNNLIKAANSIASETGVRTDEGVPFGKEHDQGLLLEWFKTFWQNYVKAQQDQPQSSLRLQQSDSPQDLFSQFDKSQAMAGGFGHGSDMRRTETEPIFRNTPSQINQNGPLGGGSLTPSPFGTGAAAAARFWGSSDISEDSVMQQLTPRTLGRETAASMQRMGWEGRPIESLSGEEKSRLANVVRQSQIHQQNASMQLINSLQPSPISLSKIGTNESRNGNNQNLGRQSPNLTIGLSSPISTMNVPPSPTTSKGHSSGVPAFNNSRKSPGQLASRKKRRSSVNLQALSQIQNAGQSGNNTSPVTNRKNGQVPPPPASPAEAARTFEEHQNLAKQLQTQSQSIIGHQGLVSPASKRTNLSKAQQAQSDAQSHATSQISAQIQQLQQQLMRDSNTGGGGSQPNNPLSGVAMQRNTSSSSNQISQLRILQGKLSQNNREQDDQSGNPPSSAGKGMQRPGSVQGPIVASQMPPVSPVTSMGPPMSAPATPFNFASQQRMSAISNSPSSAYFGGMGMPANWQGNGMGDPEQHGSGGNGNPHQPGNSAPMHFTAQQDPMMNTGNNMHPPQQGPAGSINGLGLGFNGQPGGPPAQHQQPQQQQQMHHMAEQSPMMAFDPQSHQHQNQMGLSPFTAQGQNQNPMAFLQSPKQAQEQSGIMTPMQPMGGISAGTPMMDQNIWASMGMGGMENHGMNEPFNS